MPADDVIAGYESESFETESDAMAAVAVMVAAINEEYGRDLARVPGMTWGVNDDRERKIRRWIKRLAEILKRIVDDFPHVESYAITVGFPAGVSATLTFSPSDTPQGSGGRLTW